MGPQPIKIEYEEQYVDKDKALEVFAPSAAAIRVMDATPVGDQIRIQYVVLWDNGEPHD